MYDSHNPEIPPALVPFMKKPPLVKGESAKEYYEFFEEVIAATQPEDMIDWLWTVRFTNGSWSVLRLTRFQAALLNGRYKLALHGVIRQTKIPVSTGSRVVQPNEREAVFASRAREAARKILRHARPIDDEIIVEAVVVQSESPAPDNNPDAVGDRKAEKDLQNVPSPPVVAGAAEQGEVRSQL